ncbi:DUF4097 domain-containing protein [Streptomyces sp. NPDC048111]|uniref:DUF4097 family beta strand repeat-containing protein n=1 Tax=Streptomyces sp. NPDC048111 TaxID=3365500 RepID=UPI00371D0DD3
MTTTEHHDAPGTHQPPPPADPGPPRQAGRPQPRPSDRPGERRRHRTAWIVVALIGAFFIVTPLSSSLLAGAISRTTPYTDPDNDRAHTVNAVDVDAGAARLTVTAGPARHVSLGGTLTWSLKEPRIERTWHGDTLQLTTRCDGFVDQYVRTCKADLDLAVPAGVRLTVHTGSGDLKIRDLTGSVDVHSGSAAIKLYGLSGPVRAKVGSGELQARQLTSPDVSLRTGSGSIDASFAAAPRQVKADTGSGSVSVTVPEGARYRVVGTTGSGSRSIQEELPDATSPRTLDVSSGSGSVSVGYPGY